MKNPILAVAGAIALVAATSAPSLAAVNCAIVKKNLEMGRKVEDIAANMAVSEADVKKCQQGATTIGTGAAGGHAPGTPENLPASAPAPASGKAPAPGATGN